MFVCCECCVLSGRGLCDELITRPEESYRLWCVVVCDLENLKNEEAMTRVGSQRHRKKKPHQSLAEVVCQIYVLIFSPSFVLELNKSAGMRKCVYAAPHIVRMCVKLTVCIQQ
jgi:hypothetical protein